LFTANIANIANIAKIGNIANTQQLGREWPKADR
jgi:hypothetical protein